jgi:PAS domain S-box-containing protein
MKVDNPTALLAARQEELAAIYENVPGIVFYIAVETDGEFRFLSVSRDFITATGLSREQVVGSLVRDVIPPPSRDMVLNRYREAIRSGQPVRWEEKSAYPAGHRYGEVAVTPLYDASGLVTHLIGIVHDITDRKRLEEKRADDLLEAAPDAMVVVDQSGRMILANAQTERLFGYRREEILGRNVEFLIPPRFHERHQAHRTTFFSQPRIRPMGADLQLSGLRKDGTEFPVEILLSPMQTPEGTLVTSAIRDISERKMTEEALRASEERLRLAQRAAHIGTFDWNIRTDVNTWTPEMEAMYGLPPGRFGGTHAAFESLVHPDDRARLRELVEVTLRAGKPTQAEWRTVWPDGSVHWLAAHWQVLTNDSGEASRVIGVNIDVTERKRAEEVLRESEARFRLVANSAPVMIWMSGLDKKPTYFNQLWLEFSGLSETELLNGLGGIVHPEDYERGLDVYCGAFDQRQPFRKECRLRRHDGQYRWMLDVGVPRFHQDGSFAGYIGSCIDITEHKLAEHALSDMTRKLIEAQEQERARIGRELHDDINQRLAMLGVELEQLHDNRSDIPSRVQELQKHLLEISNDVQALSHELHSSKLAYLGVVAGMKSWCRELATRRKIEIDFKSDVSSVLPAELGRSLFRVLQEAMHNAIKHSGVRRFEVQLREHTTEVHLVIRDSGRGFNLEDALQGAGLGLTSMRERVRLINGTISIESKPKGGGTTIYVRVPLGLEQDPVTKAV